MVHHRIHKSRPPVPILSQLDPLYTPPAILPKIHSDPILSYTPWSCKWSLSFWLSHQNLVRTRVSYNIFNSVYNFMRVRRPSFQKFISAIQLLAKL
jgi:hypothetical protein